MDFGNPYIATDIPLVELMVNLSIGVVLAPVLDVLSRATNPIAGSRCFSDDPDVTAQLGLAFIESLVLFTMVIQFMLLGKF